MNDEQIEKEIQEKGLTAPRITSADIEANISKEHYFTAAQGASKSYNAPEEDFSVLSVLTFCVLQLQNGFLVTGKSAPASPDNFDAELGRKIARQDAVNQMWALMGYELKQRLFEK